MKGVVARGALTVALVVVCAACLVATLASPPAAASPAAATAQAQWTFVVYMCSDNDLDEWGALNTEWLMSAPASDEVDFLVLWDTATGPARLFKATHGDMNELKDFALSGVEVNMGDSETLVALLDYMEAAFPADKVALTLWDHGDDFTGVCSDYDTAGGADVDKLSHQEIGDALAGRDVDIIAGDGCGIGVIEAACEYVARGVTAEWFVANENYVPLEGFPYDMIAADLVADPGMTPEALSRDMVERYGELYAKGWLTELSALRLSAIPAVTKELWDVTAEITAHMRACRGLVAAGNAKATMGWSQYGWEAFVDLPTLFTVVHRRAPAGSALKAETAELLAALDTFVPYVGMSPVGDAWPFGGIAEFFPGADGSYVHNTGWRGSLHRTMQFAQDGWIDFLRAYFGGTKKSGAASALTASGLT
jgi:hypothetical protein